MKSASGSGSSTSCSRDGDGAGQAARAKGRRVSVANERLGRQSAGAAVSRAVRLATLPNILLVACVVVAVWLVFVPLSALLYNAFTEDTGFGPGAFSLDNFIEAYSSWHILRLFWNSLVFALGTAVTCLLYTSPSPRDGLLSRMPSSA